MIIDTSALVTIVFLEPERERMLEAISHNARRSIGAPNWLEACMVVDRQQNLHAAPGLDDLRALLGIVVVPFGEEAVVLARAAFRTYGKGSKHPARLNFGDCMAYALAKQTGEPLLFKGDDFIHTDIQPALA